MDLSVCCFAFSSSLVLRLLSAKEQRNSDGIREKFFKKVKNLLKKPL